MLICLKCANVLQNMLGVFDATLKVKFTHNQRK